MDLFNTNQAMSASDVMQQNYERRRRRKQMENDYQHPNVDYMGYLSGAFKPEPSQLINSFAVDPRTIRRILQESGDAVLRDLGTLLVGE